MAKKPNIPELKQFEYVNLDNLKPDPANARKHDDRNIEEISRSLAEFGQHAPLVVQRSTNRILVGNGRYEAMRQLGWDMALVLYVDDDNVTAVRRSLADNRIAELAEWDDEALQGLLQGLGEEVEIPGWNDEEIEEILQINQIIDHNANADRAGASPWERIGDDVSEGVVFSFGAITAKIDKNIYNDFLQVVPENNIQEWITAVLRHAISDS